MADRVITTEALITARDGTGDVFTKIAQKLAEVGKGAKASEAVERMARSLDATQKQLKAIEQFRGASKTLDQASLSAAKARQAVTQLGVQIAASAKPTKAMQTAMEQAEKAVLKANESFKKQGAVVRDAKAALDGFGVPVSKLAAEQTRLKASIESTTEAIARQITFDRQAAAMAEKVAAANTHRQRVEEQANRVREHGIAHHGFGNYAMGAAAGYVSAHGIVTGMEETYKAGSDYQHQLVGLQNAGRTPEEIAAIQKRSSEVVSRLPTATFTGNLKVIAETTQAFGSVEHAMDHLEFMQKAMSVLSSAGEAAAAGGPENVSQNLAQWYEERMRPAEDFEKNAAMMIPAMVATGGKFNPAKLYAFAQMAKSAMTSYNDRFMSRIAPSLIAANGGESAGTAAAAFDSVITGKARDKKQAAEWARLGLLDMNQVVGGKDGPIGWKAGAVKGTNLAGQDPLEWAEKVLIPAMKAKGIRVDDRQAVKNELATLFRNGRSNFFANEIVQAQSRLRLHKDEDLYNTAGPIDEIYKRNLSADPTVGLEALKASFENLISTVSSPAMLNVAGGLSGIAKALDALAVAAKDHPIAAMAAGGTVAGLGLLGSGYLSYQLMNGFGLGSSATALDTAAVALDGSAAAITEAAGVLSAKGVLEGAAGKVAGTAGAAAQVVGGGVAGTLGSKMATLAGDLGLYAMLGWWASQKDVVPLHQIPPGDMKGPFPFSLPGDTPAGQKPPDFAKAPFSMAPADAADRAAERNAVIDEENQRVKDSVWQFGQLNDVTQRLSASLVSFDTSLSDVAGRLGGLGAAGDGGTGTGGGGVGGGFINASYETGGTGSLFNSAPAGPGSFGSGDPVSIAESLLHANGAQAARALNSRMTPGEWCADFVNGVIKGAGGKGVNSSMAAAFNTWGRAVGLNDAKRGDVILEHAHGNRINHVGMATGRVQRDANGNVTAVEMISGNYGHAVKTNWERSGIIAGMRRGEISNDRIAPPATANSGVELRGQAHVRVTIDRKGNVTDSHVSSQGHIRSSLGRSMPDAMNI